MITLNKFLKTKDLVDLVFHNATLELDKKLIKRIDDNHEFLKEYSKSKVIYGVNTGFGPMAQYRVQDDRIIELQFNLIRSHAAGTGKVFPPEHVKATMIARLVSLSKCKSGVNSTVVKVLEQMINKDVYPLIFQHGGVGASGDLVQLAHLALCVIGEGEVFYKGDRRNTKDVFKEVGIEPAEIKIREGLAMINGTSAMTGIGILNHFKAQRLLSWSIKCSAMINELVQAYDDHFSIELNSAKLHEGQLEIAKDIRDHISDSKLMKNRQNTLYSGENQEEFFKDKVQEYYSVRCIPQILGPVLDTINYTGEILEKELNSANDNPIIDSERQQVYHGGNFHGDYISLEMDKLRLVITRMTMLAERQLNFLLNHKINEILPPFVNRGVLGLNYGMQAAQFTATSTTAENQTLSNSMYVHSIPNNNDNQDIVSMGTNAAQLTTIAIENAFEVLSIELITIIQAIRHNEIQDKLSSKSQTVCEELVSLIPDIIEDKPLYPIIQKAKDYIKNH